MALNRLACGLLLGLMLTACTTAPPYRAERSLDLARPASGTTLYLVPFQTVLSPAEITAELFDRFVDAIGAHSGASGLDGVILKSDLATIDGEWLAKLYYVKGEVFAYQEDQGCCSTELSVTARLKLYQPGTDVPVLRIEVPYKHLFDPDRSSPEEEKAKFLQEVAERLRDGLLNELGLNGAPLTQ